MKYKILSALLCALISALLLVGCQDGGAAGSDIEASSTAADNSTKAASDVTGDTAGAKTTADREPAQPAASGTVSQTGATAETTEGSQASAQIPFQAVSQYPELPTGCEVTSLAAVLNFYGIDIDKCDIADNYLEKGDVGTVDFHEAFEGDPRDESSFGCYAPVIVKAAEKIIAERQVGLQVTEVSGSELDSLFEYIDKGVPVIVWGTQDCQPGQYTLTWNVDGRDLTWFSPEHCMVLTGYSDGSVWVADPIYGEIKQYDRAVFQSCYDSLYKQAVVIS